MGRVLIIIIGTVFNRFKAEIHYVFDSSLKLMCISLKIYLHKKNWAVFFSGTLWFSRAQFFIFFLGHYFGFLGCKFSKIFSGKNSLSRALLGLFSRFFCDQFCFFPPNKKTLLPSYPRRFRMTIFTIIVSQRPLLPLLQTNHILKKTSFARFNNFSEAYSTMMITII